MNILLIVNASPWGSTLAGTAARFLRAALAGGHRIPAVFFNGEGVYNGVQGRVTDPGTADLCSEWASLGRDHGIEMLLCSAASARRLPGPGPLSGDSTFREAGLAEMLTLLEACDRVVTF